MDSMLWKVYSVLRQKTHVQSIVPQNVQSISSFQNHKYSKRQMANSYTLLQEFICLFERSEEITSVTHSMLNQLPFLVHVISFSYLYKKT